MTSRLPFGPGETLEKLSESLSQGTRRPSDKGDSSASSFTQLPEIIEGRKSSERLLQESDSFPLNTKPGVPPLDIRPEEPHRPLVSTSDSVRLIEVKVYDLDGQQSIISVNPSRRVSALHSLLPNYSTQGMRLSCNNCELDPGLTFCYQEVIDGSEIYIELMLTLRCQTSTGVVTLIETGTVSISKVKMDAVVEARLDVTENYELLLNSAVLADDSTVASARLDTSSPLQLRKVNIPKPQPSSSQALLKSVFSSAFPGSNVINSHLPVAQLKKQGFRRHILDPIMYYKMTLLYGVTEDVRTEGSMITVNVEVVSWGSIPFSIDTRQTVLNLKQQLARAIKIPDSSQSIAFNGELLQDSSTLQACGLADGYTVILTCTGQNTYLFLPLEYFDSTGDRDYTIYTSPPDFGMRGGENYYPPCGWRRYGLKVTGKFEDDIWLGMCNGRGEWIVSYHGTRIQAMQSIADTGYDIRKCKAFAYGHGVYSAPHVEDAEDYTTPFTWEGRRYKLVFMNRVNPAPGALKKTREQHTKDYYVSTTDRDIRPYGILMKPI